ncbi:hypothetical protein [Methylophilus sp. 3sh_L]|uniref:hypothetical protein n=1 Tax=Methylophilus sp. 3sh_L TaxID=3377114 RepID=UPI00398EF112
MACLLAIHSRDQGRLSLANQFYLPVAIPFNIAPQIIAVNGIYNAYIKPFYVGNDNTILRQVRPKWPFVSWVSVSAHLFQVTDCFGDVLLFLKSGLPMGNSPFWRRQKLAVIKMAAIVVMVKVIL